MPFRPPLTHDQLREIRKRQPLNADVIALLWEIRRMRGMMLRAYQLHSDTRRPAGVLANCWDEFDALLRAEPCVVERNQNVSELLGREPPARQPRQPE